MKPAAGLLLLLLLLLPKLLSARVHSAQCTAHSCCCLQCAWRMASRIAVWCVCVHTKSEKKTQNALAAAASSTPAMLLLLWGASPRRWPLTLTNLHADQAHRCERGIGLVLYLLTEPNMQAHRST
jgi:hypothetical protein